MTPGTMGKPSDNTPAGYRFGIQQTEDVTEEQTRAWAARILGVAPDRLKLIASCYTKIAHGHGEVGGPIFPAPRQNFGWMVFARN